jgi:CRP-like cAMP-binding protein
MSVHLISRDKLKILTALRATEFLHSLDTSHLKKLASIAAELQFPAGEIIHREGDLGQAIYLVQEGQVAIEVKVPDYGRVTVLTIGPGQIFGLSSLFPPRRKKARARVVETTRAIVIDTPKLLDLFHADHELESAVLGRTAEVITDRVKASWLELAKSIAADKD